MRRIIKRQKVKGQSVSFDPLPFFNTRYSCLII
nr:MAG TPA_asm: hypothetical protein [Caudoviricetes sp.]